MPSSKLIFYTQLIRLKFGVEYTFMQVNSKTHLLPPKILPVKITRMPQTRLQYL
jgi:hypothetical protein